MKWSLIFTCVLAACHADSSSPVVDRPPSVDAGPDVRTRSGDPTTVTIRFGELEGNEGPWTYVIAWGDAAGDSGSLASLASLVQATHTYRALGEYTVIVTIADQQHDVGSDTLTAFVEAPGTPEVFIGAGDIAGCNNTNANATADLLDTMPGTVFVLGDNAYPDGALGDYASCYQPSWGRHRKRTHPTPGNHEYWTSGATGYFGYFGVAAGDSTRGYYSYDLGDWHIVVLNSNVGHRAGSSQVQWLQADLAAHPNLCTLAYWHHPRFSSGSTHGSDTTLQAAWQALYEAGADLVLVGHEHSYERFAPQTPAGALDSSRGIREFVVGTGGESHYPFGPPIANSEVRNDDTYGVLRLTLRSTSYEWRFVPVAGRTFSDSGSGTCH